MFTLLKEAVSSDASRHHNHHISNVGPPLPISLSDHLSDIDMISRNISCVWFISFLGTTRLLCTPLTQYELFCDMIVCHVSYVLYRTPSKKANGSKNKLWAYDRLHIYVRNKWIMLFLNSQYILQLLRYLSQRLRLWRPHMTTLLISF